MAKHFNLRGRCGQLNGEHLVNNMLFSSRVLVFIAVTFIWVFLSVFATLNQRKFPWDFLIIIIGILVDGYKFSISLLFIQMNISIPLWLPCITYLLINFRQRAKYYITSNSWLLNLIVGVVIGILLSMVVEKLSPSNNYTINATMVFYQISTVLGEELLFRSILLGNLQYVQLFSRVGIAIQAFIFTLGHSSLIFNGQWIALFGIFLLGLSSGWLTAKNKNIMGAIGLHFTYNISLLL